MNDIFDLVPFPNKMQILFILESPHIDETKLGYPAAGRTGKNMSRNIIGNDNISFGKILYEKNENASAYGIFNSCQFPLGIPEKLKGIELGISRIKDINQTKNRYDNYKKLKQFLDTIENLDREIRYKERFTQLIKASPSLETIVFCGFIAQSIFLKLYPKTPIPPYNKPVQLNSKKIHFVNHPSEIDSKWVYKKK